MDEVINYVTDEVRAMIGIESETVEAYDPVSSTEVRRFFQAVMDPAPRYWDEDWASQSRYGELVAPPAFPVHAFRRAPSKPDLLDQMSDPDFDGRDRSPRDLPALPIPLVRLLNGGYQYTFYQYARFGERLRRKSRYKDIYQKNGKSGPLVFVLIESSYFTRDGTPLFDVITTTILR